MTSSRFQSPDEPNEWFGVCFSFVTSHNVTTSPPATPIFFSLPWARKAMKRESGDQNGPVEASASTVMVVGAPRVTPKRTPTTDGLYSLSGHRTEPLLS